MCINTPLYNRISWWIILLPLSATIIGTLSNDEDDGSENVPKKMNLRSFKLNRVYLDPLNMSNAGDFSWSWILKDFIQVQKEEGKFVVVCPRPPIERQIRRFHVVVQWTSKKCTKKRDARAELLFWSLNLLLSWNCRRCRRSCLSSLTLLSPYFDQEMFKFTKLVITSFTKITEKVTVPTNHTYTLCLGGRQ